MSGRVKKSDMKSGSDLGISKKVGGGSGPDFPPLLSGDIVRILSPYISPDDTKIAVAVSGGSDSLCLLWMLSCYAALHGGPDILALTVDHGLRSESGKEAAQVCARIQDWPFVTSCILKWTGKKPVTAIQERAREKRYALMTAACRDNGISSLFLAHHINDQAETVLMRLVHGSGIDGLSGMTDRQVYDDDVTLIRPLLTLSKEVLRATLVAAGHAFVEDPSNQNTAYERVRLRQLQGVLDDFGLTPRRLSVLAGRAQRIRSFAQMQTDRAIDDHVDILAGGDVKVQRTAWESMPPEIQVRVMARFMGGRVRLEQVEDLVAALCTGVSVRRTLGGKIISLGPKWLRIGAEKTLQNTN